MLAYLQGGEAAVAQARQARRGFDEPPQTPLLAELRAVLQALAPQPGPRPRAVRPAALLLALRCGPSAPCGPPPCCLPSGAARARRAARRPAASPQVRPERCAAVPLAARRSLPCCWATGGACRSASMSCPAAAGLALAAPCQACRRCLAQRASCEPVDRRPAQPPCFMVFKRSSDLQSCTAAWALLQSGCCQELLPPPVPIMQAHALHRPACCMGAITASSPESRSGQSSYARPASCACGGASPRARRAGGAGRARRSACCRTDSRRTLRRRWRCCWARWRPRRAPPCRARRTPQTPRRAVRTRACSGLALMPAHVQPVSVVP